MKRKLAHLGLDAPRQHGHDYLEVVMGTLGPDFLNNGCAVRVKVIGKRFQGSFADPIARALRPAVGVAALPRVAIWAPVVPLYYQAR
jgi:hypothetical protein